MKLRNSLWLTLGAALCLGGCSTPVARCPRYTYGYVTYVDHQTPVAISPGDLDPVKPQRAVWHFDELDQVAAVLDEEEVIFDGFRDPVRNVEVRLFKSGKTFRMRVFQPAREALLKYLIRKPVSVAPVFGQSVLIAYEGSVGLLDMEGLNAQTGGMFCRVLVRGIDLAGTKPRVLSLSNPLASDDEELLVLLQDGKLQPAWLVRSETKVELSVENAKPIETKDRTWVAAAVFRPKPRAKPSWSTFAALGHDKADNWYCRPYTVTVTTEGAKPTRQVTLTAGKETNLSALKGALVLQANTVRETDAHVLVDAGGFGFGDAQDKDDTLRFAVLSPKKGSESADCAIEAESDINWRPPPDKDQKTLPVRCGIAIARSKAGALAFFLTREPGSTNRWDAITVVHLRGERKGKWSVATWKKRGFVASWFDYGLDGLEWCMKQHPEPPGFFEGSMFGGLLRAEFAPETDEATDAEPDERKPEGGERAGDGTPPEKEPPPAGGQDERPK